MLSLRTFPWLSVGILFGAYFTFGWFLHSYAEDWVWLVAIVFAVVMAGLLTLFWRTARLFFLTRVQSDVGYFIAILFAASFAVIAIAWVQVSAYILVILSADLLVRLDSLVRKFSDLQAFWLLLAVPALGLGLSWMTWVGWSSVVLPALR